LQEQLSKAEGYLRDRAHRKERQQQQVLLLGSCVTGLGLVAYFAMQNTWQRDSWVVLGVGGVVQAGLCLALACDNDINEPIARHPGILRGIAILFFIGQSLAIARAAVNPSGTFDEYRRAWAYAGAVPVLLYTIWFTPEMAAASPNRPLPSEGVTVYAAATFFFGGLCVVLSARGVVPDFLQKWQAGGIAMQLVPAWLAFVFSLWLLMPRTRLLGSPGRVGAWARLAARMGPTVRCMMTVSALLVTSLSTIQAGTLFPAEPPPGWTRSNAMVAEALLWFVLSALPPLLAWRWRTALFGALARLFESSHRLQDGVFMASLLAGKPLRVGDSYWLREKPELDVTLSWEDEPSWHRGTISCIEADFITVDLPQGHPSDELPAGLERCTTIWGAVNMPAEELFRCASTSLYYMHAGELTSGVSGVEMSSLALGDVGSLSNSLRRARCRPGETDFYVLHSWHDDRALRLATLARCTAQFEELHGREATLWLDSVCVDPAFKNESLLCLPIYMQACRGVLVLWGGSFCERLWCVWELYTAFAFSDCNVALTIAMLELPDSNEFSDGGRRDEVRRRLGRFDLSLAHCSNPNEEKRLRDAINAAPGGASAFEATIQGLAAQLQQANTQVFEATSPSQVGDFTLAARRAETWER
jgi:hypothetical protein